MTSPAVELNERLSDALGAHDVHPDDRDRVQQAYIAAGMDTATWDDLPDDIKALVEDIEQNYPRQSWDDPVDVPDELPE
jgi:hypothetical protein